MKAKLMTREELRALVGPGLATGVVRYGCSPEDWRLWEKHVLEQGAPTAPNRRGRRRTVRIKAKALTQKRLRQNR